MAKLTLNNKENVSNLICFDACPTIINVDNSVNNYSSYESVKYNVSSMQPDGDNPKISVNGYTINGTNNVSELYGRRFLSSSSVKGAESCAISIVNALKSIPQIAMNYDVIYENAGTFSIKAKNTGPKYAIDIRYEQLRSFSRVGSNKGTTSDELCGTKSSRVYVDLYYNDNDNQRKLYSTSTEQNYKFLTTLQKEYYKNEVSFNVTPALMSVSNNNNTTVWKAVTYAVVDGEYKSIGTLSDNYIINGYLVNQGNTYIDTRGRDTNTIPALNVSRGNDRTQYNNSFLYIYEPEFKISLYKIKEVTTESVTISYLESDETEIFNETKTINLDSGKNISTYSIPLNEAHMRDSYFIDMAFSFGTIRLNVINPPFANATCNRVYWYNSYGGVSFFDFVGDKKDDRKTTVNTYNKSILNFYKNDKQEQQVVYYRDNELTVSLTTHLIDEDGLYQLYDLQNSYKAWITINNVNYYIIITSLTVEEPSDNIYSVTIKYKYSLLDSFA